jgi:hypothetical protein
MKKKALSPTEERKLRKLKLQEEEEKINLMGSETESEGRKATQAIMEDEKKKEKKNIIDELNRLDMQKKSIKTYTDLLQFSLHNLVYNIQMPNTYQWGVWFDGRGIVLAIKDKNGVLKKRAFRPSHDPLIDHNAVKTLALWAEDLFDKCEGKLGPHIYT